MLSYISLQENHNDVKALICIEPILKAKIKDIKNSLIQQEKELNDVIYKMISIEESIKRFYATYYYRKLGIYESLLEKLKNRFFGIKKTENDSEKSKSDEELDVDKSRLKQLYRKLSKLYHPDRYSDLTEDERVFFELRMAEVNKYFQKGDVKSLELMLEQAVAEVSDEIPSYKRIEILNMRIGVVKRIKEIYKNRISNLENEYIYRLMNMSETEREKEIENKKQIVLSEIKIYSRLIRETERKV